MKVRFKVSWFKFVRFFVESGDFIGSRKSEKLRRSLKVKRPSRSTRRKVNTSQIPLRTVPTIVIAHTQILRFPIAGAYSIEGYFCAVQNYAEKAELSK